jgi:outer membrane autotransporter protein
MNRSRTVRARRVLLSHAIGLALATPAFIASGRTLNPGEMYTVVAGAPQESWTARTGSTLTLAPGATTFNVALTTSTLNATDASIRSTVNNSGDIALSVANGSVATLQGGTVRSEFGIGLGVIGRGGVEGAAEAAQATVTGSNISGGRYGASVGNGGLLVASGTQIAGTGGSGTGINVSSGTARLTDGTSVSGVVNGVTLYGDSRGGDVPDPGRHLIVDNATVAGSTGAAVRVQYLRPVDTTATLSIVNGGRLVGGNGTAVQVDARMQLTMDVAGSAITGDIVADKTATADITLGDRAVLSGGMTGTGITAGVDATASWQATRSSSVGSLRLDGTLAFAAGDTHKVVDLAGNLSGAGGRLTLNTLMNAGGADQSTDRLLIRGDVTTTGTTLVTIVPTGEGALTDTNRNGAVDASEGISIIQVAGASRREAFALAGEYVAAGPWQYTLHAFGPGEVDPAQSQLGAGSPFQWDYRLGNRYVSDCGDDCHPVEPGNPVDPTDPVPPGEPGPVDRVAVVPQLPSYMLAPMALQNYGNTLSDGLHQRLGEIRDSAYGANVGGEVFARAIGSQLNYSRNLSFQRYGYDFDQQINALQVGGGIVAVDSDQGSVRAGWALDHGTTRVTPSAADGNSRAKYFANGGSIWVTYQHGSGLWVDGVLGVRRFQGDVSTDLRGEDVGRLRAQGWTMSVEVGKPLPLGGDWTVEPQFQFRVQQLNFRDFRDKDGLDIRLGNSVQSTSRLGIQIGRTANPVLAPYGRLDLIHTSNGNPTLSASSEAWNAGDTFQTGNTGNSYRVAAGATSQLTDHVQLYGEGTWQHYVGGYGLKGWSANVGVRVTF